MRWGDGITANQVGYNIYAGSCNNNRIINNNFDSSLYMWSSYDMQGMFNICCVTYKTLGHKQIERQIKDYYHNN